MHHTQREEAKDHIQERGGRKADRGVPKEEKFIIVKISTFEPAQRRRDKTPREAEDPLRHAGTPLLQTERSTSHPRRLLS
ncbi:hypothetical protein E2C01_063480 [Portunus trituberculatus]|uniref:Uncharacterized protein n=1 Tax=Portunus trituberculatus TaxID=210409 RepID=A0A5B7HGH0_PORTR|nr:hypothetical protein [Portunus trituberculatus]